MSKRNLATMYGVGLVKKAPGTAGSFVAMLLAAPIILLPYGALWLLAGALLATWLGTQSANRYMAQHATSHDPKEIVIDELIGQWLTYSLLLVYSFLTKPGGLARAAEGWGHADPHPLKLCVFLAVGFVLFRFFDILKPWPISWADRKIKGGFGVMFDDILAAIPAALLLPYGFFWAMVAILGAPD